MDDINKRLGIALGTLEEGYAEQAAILKQTLLSQRSQWEYKNQLAGPELDQYITSLAQWDPTGDDCIYGQYIARQLANRHLIIRPDNPEDGPMIKQVLEVFHKAKRLPDWTNPKDINQYSDWHQLREVIRKLDKPVTTKKEKVQGLTKGQTKVFEVTVPNTQKTKYDIYEITEPEAMILYEKSDWCTSKLDGQEREGEPPEFTYPSWHPKSGQKRPLEYLNTGSHKGYAATAADYLSKGKGPLLVLYKNNEMYVHFAYDGTQVKNMPDIEMSLCSPALDWAMNQWKSKPGAATQAIEHIRNMCIDYPDRPK